MTNYKNIHGTNIEVVSSDPSNPVEGQVWYNSSSGALKGASVTTADAWATGGNLNTARNNLAGGGNQTNALAFAGNDAGGSEVGNTESYDGSTWTEVSDMTTGRALLAGAGTYTSALAFGGGGRTNSSEEWTSAGGTVTFTDS